MPARPLAILVARPLEAGGEGYGEIWELEPLGTCIDAGQPDLVSEQLHGTQGLIVEEEGGMGGEALLFRE